MSSNIRRFKGLFTRLPISTEIKGNASEVIFPGFVREDTDEKGVLRPNRIAQILESARAVAMDLLPFMKDISYVDKTLVIRSKDIRIEPDLYSINSGQNSEPYKVTTNVCSAGKTSFLLEECLSEVNDSSPLITCYTTMVYVDWFTRRSVSLPPGVRDSAPQRKHGGEKLTLPTIPQEGFCYEVEIQPSDMDSNQHTNQSVYFRICSETEYAAAAKLFYRGINDVSTLPLLKMSAIFNGESSKGDLLKIYTWQDNNSLCDVNFGIFKGKDPVFYSRWNHEANL